MNKLSLYHFMNWDEVLRDLRGGVSAERERGQLAPSHEEHI